VKVPAPAGGNAQTQPAAAQEDFARADASRQHDARIAELQAVVDAFVSGDGHVLQLPGGMQHKSSYHHHHHMQHIVTRLASALTLSAGMQAWERGFIHEYAGAKGLLHHTTEV